MNIPPTSSQLETVEKWAHQLEHMLDGCPTRFEHRLDDTDGIPVHTWLGVHGTIPARMLSIQFGIPEHEEGCECLTPPPMVVQIEVRDMDTQAPVPESGHIELVNPSDSVFFSLVLSTVGIFHMVGNI